MFADAKDIETDFIRQCDRVEQFVEMPRRLDGLTGFRIDRDCYEAVYADFHKLSCFSTQCLKRTSPGHELIQHRVDRFFVVLRRFENAEVLKIGHERELDLVLHGSDLDVSHDRTQLRHGSRGSGPAIADKPRRLVVPLTVEKVDGVLERPIYAVVVLGRDKDVAVE